jgi:acetyl esterase/lipase
MKDNRTAHLADLAGDDLAQVPRLVIDEGKHPLRDEGLQDTQALSDAGSQSTLVCYERQMHASSPWEK